MGIVTMSMHGPLNMNGTPACPPLQAPAHDLAGLLLQQRLEAERFTAVTHGHLVTHVACYLYRTAMQGEATMWDKEGLKMYWPEATDEDPSVYDTTTVYGVAREKRPQLFGVWRKKRGYEDTVACFESNFAVGLYDLVREDSWTEMKHGARVG